MQQKTNYFSSTPTAVQLAIVQKYMFELLISRKLQQQRDAAKHEDWLASPASDELTLQLSNCCTASQQLLQPATVLHRKTQNSAKMHFFFSARHL